MPSRSGIVTLLIAMQVCVCGASASRAARVGVQGGIQGAGLTFRPDLLDHDLKFRPSWSAGIQWVVPVARLELETGVRYFEYGDRFDLAFDVTGGPSPEPTESAYQLSMHHVWRYVAVPALVRVRPVAARGLFVSLGPEVGYLLAVWHAEKLSATGGGSALASSRKSPASPAAPMARIFEEVGTFDGLTRYQRRWNLSACAAIGFEFPVGRRLAEAQLRYTHGVVDVAKSHTLTRETRGLEMLASLRW